MHLLLLTAVLLAATSDTTTSARTALSPAEAPFGANAPSSTTGQQASLYGGPPDTLALGWLEREALLRNPSLAAMRAAAAEARARARTAGSLEDPMVEIAVAPRSYTAPYSGGMSSDAMGPPASEERPAYRWGVRQRIPLFGERGLERRSARAEAAAAMLGAEAARLDLLQEVRLAFFDLYRIDREIQTITAQVDLMNHFRRIALSRYASGSEGQQDALQADTELGMLVHGEALLLRERRVMRARLNALLHRAPELPLPPLPLRIELPAPPDSVRSALAIRAPWPELRASDAQIEANEALAKLASRRRLPVFEVGFERDFFMPEWERRSVVTLGFNLPIGLGRLKAGEAEAQAALERARSEHLALADRVGLRLAEARANYEEYLREVEVLETVLLPTSERSLAGARAAYESGRGSFLPVIEASRRRIEARLSLEVARMHAARGWAELERAVAGDALTLTPDPNSKESQR